MPVATIATAFTSDGAAAPPRMSALLVKTCDRSSAFRTSRRPSAQPIATKRFEGSTAMAVTDEHASCAARSTSFAYMARALTIDTSAHGRQRQSTDAGETEGSFMTMFTGYHDCMRYDRLLRSLQSAWTKGLSMRAWQSNAQRCVT